MDINDRLEQEQLQPGGPQLNPDEQRRFLGTYRERVIAAIKVSQLGNADIKAKFAEILAANTGTLLIDQDLVGDYLTDYLKLANQNQRQYRIISGHPTAPVPDPNAIVFAADHAVNQNQIYL